MVLACYIARVVIEWGDVCKSVLGDAENSTYATYEPMLAHDHISYIKFQTGIHLNCFLKIWICPPHFPPVHKCVFFLNI